jgi:molecular chaperone Hsp33
MIHASLNDPVLEAQLQSLSPDSLGIFTLSSPSGPAGGDLRGAVIHGTRLVAAMRANHGLGVLETLILGQAYLAAALMGSTLKGEDKVSLRLDCEGPARGYSVEGRARTDEEGRKKIGVRGYLLEDPIPVSAPLDSFDTAPFIGQGSLTVTRFIAGSPRPFSGAVKLSTGRLAEDLAWYYLSSEQTQTAFSLGLSFDTSGRLSGAGGIFLQALPGAQADFVSRAEAGLLGLPSLGPWFGSGKTSADLLDLAFHAQGLARLETHEVAFSCDCSRERFASFIANSGPELLTDLVENGPWPTLTTCHNCGSVYSFPKDELLAMAAARKAKQEP